jgi:hypothetical protein
MNSQAQLFHEDFRDALRHAIKALGGFEAVAVEIWPAKTRKAAGIWLSDCMNPERPAKFDLEEIGQLVRLARERGIHAPMHTFCDETGYSRPDIAPARTPQQQLAERMRLVVQEFERLAEEHAAIERAEAVGEIRRVRTSGG